MEEKLEIPFDNTYIYIAYQCVDNEQEENEQHFSIIWTSKNLLAQNSDEFIQDDATYRPTWQGNPFFVLGRETSTGKFFPSHVLLAYHEDTRAWETYCKFVKEIAIPKYRMVDRACIHNIFVEG